MSVPAPRYDNFLCFRYELPKFDRVIVTAGNTEWKLTSQWGEVVSGTKFLDFTSSFGAENDRAAPVGDRRAEFLTSFQTRVSLRTSGF
jgi:hypothetical protein